MPNISGRYTRAITCTILAGEAESEVIDVSRVAMLVVHMPSAWTAASIGFKASNTVNGTFGPVSNNTGLVQISSPTAGQARITPGDFAALRFIKLWSQDGSGNDVAQVADREIGISVKA